MSDIENRELYRQPIIDHIKELVGNMIEINYDSIHEIWHDAKPVKEIRLSVAINLAENIAGEPYIDTKLSYSEEHSEQLDCKISDPRQGTLDIPDITLCGKKPIITNGKGTGTEA